MNAIFKIMMFSITLNLSVGLLLILIPAFNDPSVAGGLHYNPTLSNSFTSNMEQTITPDGTVQDKTDAIYRVLDMMNLGFISNFLTGVKTLMFGFVLLIENIVGGWLDPEVRIFLFGGYGALNLGLFNIIISIGYVMGGWYLWTGRDVSKD